MKTLLLCGEGASELGRDLSESGLRGGVVGELLARSCEDATPCRVIERLQWKNIRKFQRGKYGHADARNVLGLALYASEKRADLVVFVRDRDGERERERAIRDAIEGVPTTLSRPPRIVGGVAVERIESWVASLAGMTSAEGASAKAVEEHLAKCGITLCVDDYESAVRTASLGPKTPLAPSLRGWLGRATEALGAAGSGLVGE